MSLVSQAIPSLFNGVSQQSPQLRSASQVEEQINLFPDLALGLHDRPPTEHIAVLYDTAPAQPPFTHFINRDRNERYVVCLDSASLKVFDLSGNQKTVTLETPLAPLVAVNPRDDVTALSVADTTFLASRRLTPSVASGYGEGGRVFATVTWADTFDVGSGYHYELSITFNGVTHSGLVWVVPPEPIDVAQVVDSFAYYFQAAFPTWSINTTGARTIAFTGPPGLATVPTISQTVRYRTYSGSTPGPWSDVSYLGTTDSGTAAAPGAIQGVKQKYSELPTSGLVAGHVWKVQGEPESSSSEYWIKWDGTVWVETFAPGYEATFADTTMPLTLIRASDGEFLLREGPWEKRKVGNNRTNPIPSFVGKGINGMFYFRGRFGMVAGENIVMSRTTNPYDFWAESTTQALDTDPIDVEVTAGRISPLRHAVPFDKSLMLFSDQSQMQLTAGDVLTQKTARIDPITEYEANPLCVPTAIGQSLFYAADAGDSSVLREYFVTDTSVATDAANLTAHVPSYVPSKVRKQAACTTFDFFLTVNDTKPHELHIYKFYWGVEEKLQSAWGKMSFGAAGAVKVLDAEFIGSVCYLVVQRGTIITLEKMDFQPNRKDTGISFLVHLDQRAEVTGTYVPDTDTTVWTLPYTTEGCSVVLGGGFGESLAGSALSISSTSGTTVTASGDWSAYPCIVGFPYERRARISQQYVRDKRNGAVLAGVLKLRSLLMSVKDTGYLRGVVTAQGRAARSFELPARIKPGAAVGGQHLIDGAFKFPVMADSRWTQVDLINDTHYPCRIISGEWLGEFVQRSQRL
jgi:hypothetical protein